MKHPKFISLTANCKKYLFYFIAALILIGNPTEILAQKRGNKVYVIKTKDGNQYAGEILSEKGGDIVIKTESLGEIQIKEENIKSMKEIDRKDLVDGEYLKVNSKTARYFFAPSARALRKGEGYYQNTWVLFNQFNYGLTDNITVGLGFVPLFLFNGAPTPIWFTPKISFPISDNVALGGGILAATIIGDVGSPFAGSAYGAVTLGGDNGNFTAGLGYGFADGQFAETPLVTLSGLMRISKKTFLMTENYLVGFDGTIVSLTFLGGRTAWENFQLDYGLITSLNSFGDGFSALPWLSVAIPFGK